MSDDFEFEPQLELPDEPLPPLSGKQRASLHLQNIGKNTENFFVLKPENNEKAVVWENRRMRMASSMGNGIKENYVRMSKTDDMGVEGTPQDDPGAPVDLPKKRRKKSVLLLTWASFTSKSDLRQSWKDRRRRKQSQSDRQDRDIVTTVKETLASMLARGRRRRFGIGIAGEFFERKLRSSIVKSVRPQIDNLDDHRPFFSYWVTFVQTVIMITSLVIYGFAPIGIGVSTVTGNVHMPNLAIQTETRLEVENLWIGPRQADLIHLGAKYSPCMRADVNLRLAIDHDRSEEGNTACCIRKDGSGCVQMVKSRCDNVLSTWLKWTNDNPGPDGRISGSVCGQDPRYCNNPASTAPYEWPDQIITWPVCLNPVPVNTSLSHKNNHMHCEILGRPCCFGIQGECTITTDEHCNLLRGFFHPKAALCSQINCIQEVCGMIPFANSEQPDQFYRLVSSLFLHGGVVHLGISMIFQMWIMRDLEKLLGTIRMVIIYFGSGIAGNLASCTFLPYTVEVGPSGAHFGVAACLFVEVIQSYQMFKHPHLAVFKLCLPIAFLFVLGLLPWVDNWAHLFGFFFGFLLAFSLMPYVTFGHFDKRRKLITVFACLGASVVLFAILIVIFYYAPLTDCEWCAYFNCIPLTVEFCDNMNVQLKKHASYSKFHYPN
ncbi:hypothetical protein BsWGS_21039 [Bradybaena similaris]